MKPASERARSSRTFTASAAGAAFAVALAACAGAAADDTEIFFGQVNRTAAAAPNVLFVLDTSGSMTNTDGTGLSRLQRLKDALYTIVDKTTDVNVGLMRFQGYRGGSSVIFPLTDIDADMCTVEGSCDSAEAIARVSSPADDTEERASDGREAFGGFILSMPGASNAREVVGLRFDGLDVPQGATITSASIEMTSHYDAAAASSYEVSAHDLDDAPPFTAANGSVGDRPVAPGVAWVPDAWKAGDRYSTSDLAATVQDVVNRPGWCGGNAMSFEVSGTGDRAALSYEHAARDWGGGEGMYAREANVQDAAVLRVAYDPTSVPATGGCSVQRIVRRLHGGADDAEQDVGTGRSDLSSTDLELPKEGEEQYIGLHFADSGLPAGAEIIDARIEFQIDEYANDRDDVSLWIDVERSLTAAEFDGETRGVTDSDRPLSNAPLAWNDLPLPDGDGDRLVTPDLAPLVRSVVDQGGWSPELAINFTLWRKAGTGRRTVEAYDGDPAGSAKLLVAYRVPSGAYVASSATSVRRAIKRAVFEIDHAGGTPIVDAFYEAAQYFLGGPVHYGRQRGVSGGEKTTNRVSAERSWQGSAATIERTVECAEGGPNSDACKYERIVGDPVYASPMTSSCQSNHLVVLSDGRASSISAGSRIRALIGTDRCSVGGNEACGRELARWLYEKDQRADVPGKQNVRVHTIGFALQDDDSAVRFAQALASSGGGDFHEATNAGDLVAAFDTIVSEAQSIGTSFVAPGTTVNQFNRLTHRNDIYFALFKPESEPRWRGNLKRYGVGGRDGGIVILDEDGNDAVNETTGYFDDDATSWWSGRDGSDVTVGGAAEQLLPRADSGDAARSLYTFVGPRTALAGTASVDLADPANALHEANPDITGAMLGLRPAASAGERAELLKWARGLDRSDVDQDGDVDEQRGTLGDPMHSRPVILNYANPDTVAGTGGGEPRGSSPPGEPAVRTTVFVGTNEGLLHAIDREGGAELYAFMPRELLPNVSTLRANDASQPHPYGLDGALSLWSDDVDNNVMVDDGESAFLYAGMRRGGSSYYAFDVSDRRHPKLAWVITGGPEGTPGFEELGQSWSKPVPTSIMVDGVKRDVVVFGAGYAETQDPDYDAVDRTRTVDRIGRGFYIVDARTGELVRAVLSDEAAGGPRIDAHASLEHSVPGDLRVIDVDFDGLADQLWFGDMGGRIWRWDVAPYHQPGQTLLRGGVMAALGGDDYADNRRFYYEPDVSLVGESGDRFLSISIGSGWRAHPLNTKVKDRFYVLRSSAVYRPPAGYGKPPAAGGTDWSPITDADLTDVTDELSPTVSTHGWYVNLEQPGEKVLGDTITVNNQVVFTTYVPEGELEDCATALGSGRVYAMRVFDGSPTIDADGDGLEKEDRHETLAHGGIPPEPAALITEDGPTILVGPEQPLDLDFDNLTQRSYWRDNGRERRLDTAEGE